MTTDLRAALRDAIHALTEYTSGVRTDATIAELRALADAPPTVAEMLTDERFIAGTHAIAFTCHDGAELWIRAGAWKAFTVEVNPRGKHRGFTKKPNLYAYDFRQPGRLVEVSP